MPTNIRAYIRENFARGLKKDQIESNLINTGWEKAFIDQAFEDVKEAQKEFIERHRKRILPSKNFLSGTLRIILIIVVTGAILLVFILVFKYLTRPKPSLIANLKIDGDENCVTKTNQALNLLRDRVQEEYNNVAKYVNLIKCDQFVPHPEYSIKNGNGLTEFRVDLRTVDSGPVWYAGAIIHETCHARQFQEWEAIKADLSPEELERERTKDLEAECYRIQADALKKLGADQKTLDYAKNLH